MYCKRKSLNNDISKHISYNIDCDVFIEFNFFTKVLGFKNLRSFRIRKHT